MRRDAICDVLDCEHSIYSAKCVVAKHIYGHSTPKRNRPVLIYLYFTFVHASTSNDLCVSK